MDSVDPVTPPSTAPSKVADAKDFCGKEGAFTCLRNDSEHFSHFYTSEVSTKLLCWGCAAHTGRLCIF